MKKTEFKRTPYTEQLAPGQQTLHILNWHLLSDDKATRDPEIGFPLVLADVLDWDDRLPKIVDYILWSDADVVTLQEASRDVVDRLEKVYAHTKLRKPGNVILWKREKFRVLEEYDIVHTRAGDAQSIVTARLLFRESVANEQLFVVCTRFKAITEHRRMQQVMELLIHIKDRVGKADYAVLGMDLNAGPESEVYRYLTGDLFMGNSYNPWAMHTHDKTAQVHPDTTFKYRYRDSQPVPEKMCSDFIMTMASCGSLHSTHVGVVEDLSVVYQERGLPDASMPSDHVPLQEKFTCCLSPAKSKQMGEMLVQNDTIPVGEALGKNKMGEQLTGYGYSDTCGEFVGYTNFNGDRILVDKVAIPGELTKIDPRARYRGPVYRFLGSTKPEA